MVQAMDECITYMTAALICHPPRRKLEKVGTLNILNELTKVIKFISKLLNQTSSLSPSDQFTL